MAESPDLRLRRLRRTEALREIEQDILEGADIILTYHAKEVAAWLKERR